MEYYPIYKDVNQMPRCYDCTKAELESWPKGKVAVRCRSGDSRYDGFVTEIFNEGFKCIISDRPAPAWCRWYEKGGEEG